LLLLLFALAALGEAVMQTRLLPASVWAPSRAKRVYQQRVDLGQAVHTSRATGTTTLYIPSQSAQKRSPTDPMDSVRHFLSLHKGFGVKNMDTELVFKSRVEDEITGGFHLRFQQVNRGVPVYGGALTAHFGPDGQLQSLSGSIVPGLDELSATAVLPAAKATSHALELHPNRTVTTGKPILQFFRTKMSQDAPGTNHLAWVLRVDDALKAVPARELVIDAHTGAVLASHQLRANAINRDIFQVEQKVWSEGDSVPSDPLIQKILDASSSIFNLYKNMFNFEFPSKIRIIYGLSGEDNGCPNAFYADKEIHLCRGFETYDTIGHEWTHGYLEFISDGSELVYVDQSGALNEAMADIFAETLQIDLQKPVAMPVRPVNDSTCFQRKAAGASGRWIVGDEESVQYRDMQLPECFQQPGYVGSELLFCVDPAEERGPDNDNGGVHINSGIPNKAFQLMVDGGILPVSKATVAGLGTSKALNIVYRVLRVYSTPTMSFGEWATHLDQACSDLVGKDIKDIKGAAATPITAADCQALTSIIDDLGLRKGICNTGASGTKTVPALLGTYPPGLPVDTADLEFVAVFSTFRSNTVFCHTDGAAASKATLLSAEGFMAVICNVPSRSEPGKGVVAFSFDGSTLWPSRAEFEYFPELVVTDFSPKSGEPGTRVTVTGQNFKEFDEDCIFTVQDYNGDEPNCVNALMGDIEKELPLKANLESSTKVNFVVPPLDEFLAEDDNKKEVWVSINSLHFYRNTELPDFVIGKEPAASPKASPKASPTPKPTKTKKPNKDKTSAAAGQGGSAVLLAALVVAAVALLA